MAAEQSPKYRFMVETPNHLKLCCSNEKDLSKILEQYGLSAQNPISTGTSTRKSNTLSSKIKQILDNKPLTLQELRLEISKNTEFSNIRTQDIFNAIGQSKEILSDGPRRHKLYFLKGQESERMLVLN